MMLIKIISFRIKGKFAQRARVDEEFGDKRPEFGDERSYACGQDVLCYC